MKNGVVATIVNWNSGQMLKEAVESILRDDEVDTVFVVDNASSDKSLRGVREVDDRVQVLENKSNRGFAGAVNQAFDATNSAFVLILNPDIQATPDAIGLLAEVLESNPRVGAVGGFVSEGYHPRPFPTLGSLSWENLGLPRFETSFGRSGAQSVDQVAGAAFMVRRAAFDEVGGFDEQFFPAWYEDVDFCKMISKSGWKICFHPEARFHHDGGYSIETMGLKKFLSAYYKNQIRYARKHLGARSGFSIRVALVFGMVFKMICRPRRAITYWKVIRDVVRG